MLRDVHLAFIKVHILYHAAKEDVFGIGTAEVTKKEVLQASGHARGFADMLSECEKCKRRFRADRALTGPVDLRRRRRRNRA